MSEDDVIQPSIVEGNERGFAVLAVGYFADDENEVICVHKMEDREGAERCLAAELKMLAQGERS
jgi:hypothetical protein